MLAQDNVKVHCTFSTAGTDHCSITPQVYFIDEYEKAFNASIRNNECDLVIPLSKPTIGKFSVNNQPVEVFLQPGDELTLKFGTSTPGEISFSGKGAAENQFLLAFNKKFVEAFDDAGVAATILNSDIDAFEMSLYDDRKKQLDFLTNYPDKNSLSTVFQNYITNTIRYNYYSRLLSFPIIQANQSAQIKTVRAMPAVMLNSIDSKLVNDEALNCKSYRDFLNYYDIYFTSAANNYAKFTDLSLSMESKVVTANKNFSGQSLVWFIAWYLNANIASVSQYTAKHTYETLSLKENNGTYTQLLKSKVQQQLSAKTAAAKEEENSKSSSATSNYPKLKDPDGKYFTFDDLKGKVVYVDYWASWCGPCRMEMPYSKQLHAMFDEKQLKQIVFLYVSIDADENAWKNATQQLGLEGKFGISPGNWTSEIAKFFKINSIPRYMLINKKGEIVNLNANRPSSGAEIYQDIIKLLD